VLKNFKEDEEAIRLEEVGPSAEDTGDVPPTILDSHEDGAHDSMPIDTDPPTSSGTTKKTDIPRCALCGTR
jgi:hypothetical protein